MCSVMGTTDSTNDRAGREVKGNKKQRITHGDLCCRSLRLTFHSSKCAGVSV